MYGLLKYEDAEQILADGPGGCFLFRLSNSSPDQLCLTLKNKKGQLLQQKMDAFKDLRAFKSNLDS
jgi:hypothetical protein